MPVIQQGVFMVEKAATQGTVLQGDARSSFLCI